MLLRPWWEYILWNVAAAPERAQAIAAQPWLASPPSQRLDSQPSGTVLPDTTKQCTYWYDDVSKADTCASIEAAWACPTRTLYLEPFCQGGLQRHQGWLFIHNGVSTSTSSSTPTTPPPPLHVPSPHHGRQGRHVRQGGEQAGYYYCVAADGVAPTSTTSSSSPQPTGPPGPSPTQDGLVASCARFYLAVKGDTCGTILRKYGTFYGRFKQDL
ncbi:hypothetical protein CCM_08840 [Cordyceps militaris CM01]|uniref:Uncharacterized protein n=1 Tax=Cordyceps militaris (strain CM01) TaxID=983644 RepID=G3JS95_CORMM|nr:uncharacterized protein CCM_08840 [Cordyceps militaris CM01]EGX88794.1 hypothetical protein CCM_08840 [Cordyceps militaris CM01]